jgi:tRNA(Arg) A34 adenosine deaminase TadA
MAGQAAKRGDRPCGSLLVVDESICARDTNRVNSDDDIALHPELSLVRQLARRLTETEQQKAVLYTTIEPCSMCATAITYTKLSKVVYSVPGDRYWELAARSHSVPDDYIGCTEVFDRLGANVDIVGSVLEDEALSVIRDCLDQ